MKNTGKNGKYRYTRFGGPGAVDASESIADEIMALPMRPVDEAKAIPRPAEIDKYYVEEAVEKRAEEQPLLWEAEGEAASREWQVEAAELAKAATVADSIIANQQKVANHACECYETTARTLGGYTRRPPYEKWPYYIRWLLILGGDVAGVAGAAILLGETVELGLLQAIASGTAAITSGLLAHEIKDSRLGRKREKPPKELTSDEKRFAHLFKGGDSGERIVTWVVGGGLVIGGLIAGSIFALRLTTEGSTAGWAFGLLAAAVSLASWANVYHYTDEIADLIDARRADYERELKALKKLSKDEAIARRDAATTEAASIRAETGKRGEAGAKGIEAFGKQLVSDHSGVAGHGWPKDPRSQESHEEDREETGATDTSRLPGMEKTVSYDVPPEVVASTDGNSGDHEGEE